MKNRFFRKIGLIAVLLVLCCAPVLAGAISVQVEAQASVRGPQITFGELAEIHGADEARCELLRNLKLGPSPQPGERLIWTDQMLGSRLASTGADFSGINWQMPPTLTITAGAQTVQAEQLKTVSLEAIRQLLGPAADSGNITIDLIGEVRDLMVSEGIVKLSATLPSGVHYAALTTVVIRVDIQDRSPVTTVLNYDVRLYRNIIIAGKDIGAHELITPEALHLERLEVGRLSAGYFTDFAEIAGYAAKRPLAPGMIITKSMLEKPVLIQRGAMVAILAKAGPLQVTAQGEALQDGRNGQLIRVRNIESRKIILAQIVDSDTVLAPAYYRP